MQWVGRFVVSERSTTFSSHHEALLSLLSDFSNLIIERCDCVPFRDQGHKDRRTANRLHAKAKAVASLKKDAEGDFGLVPHSHQKNLS